MKPILLALGLAVASLCAWREVVAQPPARYSAPLPDPHAWPIHAKAWGTVPAPAPLPYGYWWNDYRGADIEHPLYAPRDLAYRHRTPPAGGLMSQLCCVFDSLFAGRCAEPQPLPGECLQPVAELPPPAPTLSPVPIPSHSLDSSPQEPTPAPRAEVGPPPRMFPDFTPSPPAPAPLVVAPQPAPDSPASAPPALKPPIIEPATPPVLAVPQELPSERSPVVELAPDFAVPTEPAAPNEPTAPAPPRNRIPKPTAAPRNVIPGQR